MSSDSINALLGGLITGAGWIVVALVLSWIWKFIIGLFTSKKK